MCVSRKARLIGAAVLLAMLGTPATSLAAEELASIMSVGPGAKEESGAPCPPREQTTTQTQGGWYGDWQKMKEDLDRLTGTTFDLCVHNQEQVILTGPGRGKERHTFWWHLNIEQRLWPDARLITSTRGGGGDGLANVLPTRLNTDWESNEPDPIYVSQFFLQQKLANNRLTLSLGKMGLGNHFDTNAVGDWDFLSYSLARNPTSPTVWHVLAAMARYDVTDKFYVQAGIADANGSPTELGFNTAARGNHATFSLFEAGVTPRFGGRPGAYRLTLWHDTRPVDRPDGDGSNRGDVGFGLSFDQEIADKTVAFVRYAYADPEFREAEHFWSLGLKRTGLLPGRPDDVLAVGFAQEIMGKDWRRADASRAASESLLEAYYSIRIAAWCDVVPHVQVIKNPDASRSADTAVVAGVNLKLKF
jgi:hypothetical protein